MAFSYFLFFLECQNYVYHFSPNLSGGEGGGGGGEGGAWVGAILPLPQVGFPLITQKR